MEKEDMKRSNTKKKETQVNLNFLHLNFLIEVSKSRVLGLIKMH